jgi:sensor histidine kinase regulating citrate/malate metabolism
VETQGLTVQSTAVLMGLTTARVERLLEEEADRRALAQLQLNEIDNAAVRLLLEQRRRSEPQLTAGELARRLGTSPVQVERWLGLRATAPKTDRAGHRYPSRTLSRVSVEVGGRMARAIGYAPCEIDGC